VPKGRRFDEKKIKLADEKAHVFDSNRNKSSDRKQMYLVTRKA